MRAIFKRFLLLALTLGGSAWMCGSAGAVQLAFGTQNTQLQVGDYMYSVTNCGGTVNPTSCTAVQMVSGSNGGVLLTGYPTGPIETYSGSTTDFNFTLTISGLNGALVNHLNSQLVGVDTLSSGANRNVLSPSLTVLGTQSLSVAAPYQTLSFASQSSITLSAWDFKAFSGGTLTSLQFDVPEPASMSLLGLGLLGLVRARRRI